MRLHNLFHLDPSEPIFLAENSFSDQREALLTENYLNEFENIGGNAATRKGVDGVLWLTEHGIPIAIAVYVHSQGIEHWLVLTNVVSKDERFSERVSGIFGSGSEEIETDAPDIRSALIEYYSIFLVNQWLCESCAREDMPYLDLGVFAGVHEMIHNRLGDESLENGADCRPEERSEQLSHLLREIRDKIALDLSGADALEICCGDGSATAALRDLGCDPICIDYDKCDICDGLKSGQLRDERSIVLDATELSLFFDREFDCVAGFMVGPIQPFNEDMWASILRESVKVVRTGGILIFTFHSGEELGFAYKVLEGCGVFGEAFENPPDTESPAGRAITGYDRWVYAGRWDGHSPPAL
ncbi:MAG TPA: class I SAM-dependent methyltransferase [Methanosarcinales archaeon]|nr:class I SAM-dependent methyltransferase [Methanosarcinales archaeon]